VYIDGGVLNGADVVAAVARGARAVMVGRAYLYGLMAGGERGVARAGELIRQEFVRTMRLLGVASVPDLKPERALLRDH
jgi:L-lactate dehydrogenase (cytochrome)